jgi:hypothetical protein
LLHETDAGEEEANFDVYKNLTNGVILRAADLPPPTGVQSCSTTIFSDDNCNYRPGISYMYEMDVSEVQPLFSFSNNNFAPKSILMAEQTDIKLFSQARFGGQHFDARNTFQVEEDRDNCICMKLTNQQGDPYRIESFNFTNNFAN